MFPYLGQEVGVLCKFLESAVSVLQVQAAALGGGPEVSVFSVGQKDGVSARWQSRQIKNTRKGSVTSSTFDPGSIYSNRKRSRRCCGFPCEGKKAQNKVTQLLRTHAYVVGRKTLCQRKTYCLIVVRDFESYWETHVSINAWSSGVALSTLASSLALWRWMKKEKVRLDFFSF